MGRRACAGQRLVGGLWLQRQVGVDGARQVLAGGLSHQVEVFGKRRENTGVTPQNLYPAKGFLDLDPHAYWKAALPPTRVPRTPPLSSPSSPSSPPPT